MRSIVIMAASIFVLLLLFMAPTFSNSEEIETLPGFPGKLPFKLQTGVSGYHRLYLGFDVVVGPFTINYANSTTGDIPSLELNPYAWTKVANIIFLDQPAGTGFSYSKTWEAYRSSDTLSAQYAYSFLIKGYLEGNPLTDKYADFNNRVVYAHRMGLLSDNLYKMNIRKMKHVNMIWKEYQSPSANINQKETSDGLASAGEARSKKQLSAPKKMEKQEDRRRFRSHGGGGRRQWEGEGGRKATAVGGRWVSSSREFREKSTQI
nr:serine carboxypeptidase-like 18 isoform X2 [Ipomoea batatas]